MLFCSKYNILNNVVFLLIFKNTVVKTLFTEAQIDTKK